MTLPRYRLCRGLLFVFEGVDGAGKTTQVRLLAERLQAAGYDVLCLQEPTAGPWGQKLRHLAQHGREAIAPATELEWFLQDRREDVEHNIQPALARGQIVVLDRYYFATKPLRRPQICYFSCTCRRRRAYSASDNAVHSVTSSA